jgi:SAM-dependent methyltransferase
VENAGFLTYDGAGGRFDRAISNVALHHLPDFWKSVALMRVHDLLTPGGLFYLRDVVFSFDVREYETVLNGFLRGLEERTDAEFVRDGILHLREEYSTYDWVLDAMIERAGLRIRTKTALTETMMEYLAERPEA